MATTSYGKITIIDVTDVGNFSVYPYANGPNTQIYSEETNQYYPNWEAKTGSTYTNPLILTPVVTYAGQDKTTEATVNWYLKTDLEHPITTGNGYEVVSSTKQLKITKNISTANTYIVYVVKAHYISETGAEVDAEGEITFSLLTQPSSIKNVSISGTNVIKYASDSSTPNPSQVTLTATLTGGTNITGDGWKYWNGSTWMPSGNSYITTGNPTGLEVDGTELTVTASYDNSATYFNADAARFKYIAHATADSTDVYEDIFTVFQLRDGATGSQLVVMDLTNDDQLVPINQSGTPQWDVIGDLASTTVHIYEGKNDITSTSKVSNLKATLTNVTVELYNGTTKYIGTWNNGSNLPSGYYTVKVVGFTNNATSGSVRFDATINGLNYNKTFSLLGQTAGVDGKTPTIYTLEFPSVPAYVNNPTGSAASQTLVDDWSYVPENLEIKAYEIVTNASGVTTRNAYNGTVWYKPNIENGSPATDTGGNLTWGRLDLSNGTGTLSAASKLITDYSPYTFRLVAPNANNLSANIKDEESINIVSDGNIGNAGNAGKDSINLLINNENVTLNATSAGKTRSATITVGYQGYKGTVENNDFTYKSYSENRTGANALVSSVTPRTSNGNKYLDIIIKANKTVTKGETGTITLNFNYKDGTSEQVSINKIISWDAKLDAIDGSPAITLTFEYGGDKTTYFKNETGTTKVTPILLENAVNILDNTYTVVWKDLITNTTLSGADIDSDGVTAIIDASDITGVGSYSCTVSKNSKSYVQYVSFTDYSDPLQVEIISTVGDKLTNGVGEGVIYPQTTRDGVVLDQVSSNSIVVWGHSATPTSSDGVEGDFWFNTSNNTLYKRGASSWSTNSSYAQIFVLRTGNVNPIELRTLSSSTYPAPTANSFSTLQYIWSFRDGNGNVLNPQTDINDLKISYINSSTGPTTTTTNVTGGQFMYINKSVVDNKITVLCQVTKN